MRLALSLLVLALALAGCGQYSAVNPGPRSVAGDYNVSPSVAWNSRKMNGAEIWTIDGEGLQVITFLKGVDDGKPIFPDEGARTYPVFRADMTPSDIAEAFTDGLAISGGADPRVLNLRPQQIGAHEGFRFEFTFIGETGLEYLGSAVGAVVEGELRLVYYRATRLHYYERHRDEFDRIADRITFT